MILKTTGRRQLVVTFALLLIALPCLTALAQQEGAEPRAQSADAQQSSGAEFPNEAKPAASGLKSWVVQRTGERYAWLGTAASVVVILVITIGVATGLKRLVRRQELWTLRGIDDDEKAQRIRTPFLMIRQVVVPLIYFVGTIVILMQFEAFRRLGTAFLASAGVAGIVVGMAARSTLANAVAGIMLVFSQPIRVGDTVVIGDDYGAIEEVGLMYTTFKTWDNRRVMIPNEIMADKEITNYSIRDKRIWAKVPIHLDYSADVTRARQVLIDIARSSEHWDGKEEPAVWFMEMGEQTITIWVAAWAKDPIHAWGLKCDILDNALVRFKEEGIALPRRRYQYEGVKVTLEPGMGPGPDEP